MKKAFPILFMGLLILTTACNKNSINPDTQAVCLLTKITSEIEEYDNSVSELIFEYNNEGRPIKIESLKEQFYATAEYDKDGEINKVISYKDGIEYNLEIHTWTNNNRTSIAYEKNDKNEWIESGYKSIYELDKNGLILKTKYYSKHFDEWEYDSYDLYTWEKGNIRKKESWRYTGNKRNFETKFMNRLSRDKGKKNLTKLNKDIEFWSFTYEYDDNNNSNSSLSYFWGFHGLNKNNATKIIEILNADTAIYDITYEYNDKGFPIKSTSISVITEVTAHTHTTLFEYDCN